MRARRLLSTDRGDFCHSDSTALFADNDCLRRVILSSNSERFILLVLFCFYEPMIMVHIVPDRWTIGCCGCPVGELVVIAVIPPAR